MLYDDYQTFGPNLPGEALWEVEYQFDSGFIHRAKWRGSMGKAMSTTLVICGYVYNAERGLPTNNVKGLDVLFVSARKVG